MHDSDKIKIFILLYSVKIGLPFFSLPSFPLHPKCCNLIQQIACPSVTFVYFKTIPSFLSLTL